MRVLIALVALAAAPFAVAASQNRGDAAVKDAAQCANADANRNPQSYARERPADPKGRERTGCSPVAPAPAAPPPALPPPPPPPVDGGGTITGTVFPQQAGWAIVVTGPIAATLYTDAAGNYKFDRIPPGVYTVCEVMQPGWRQYYPASGPACGEWFGWTIDLKSGGWAAFVSFGNVLM